MSRSKTYLCLLALAGSFFIWAADTCANDFPPATSVALTRTATARQFSIPLVFAPDAGDQRSSVQFVSIDGSGAAWLGNDGLELRLADRHSVRIEALGAKRLRWVGGDELAAKINRFIGADKRTWQRNVPLFQRVETKLNQPGLTWVVYGNGDSLEYDLRVAPGADASQVRLKIEGAGKPQLAADGDLVIAAGEARVVMRRPRIFEESGTSAESKPVAGGFVIEKDGSIRFAIGPRDKTRTLVIDPSIRVTYSTFFGGTGNTSVASVATDSAGNVYVGGTTTSFTTWPVAGTQQGSLVGGSQFFVAKINPAAGPNQLEYLTFLGGSGAQSGGLIAVDSQGDVAITGTTTSFDFPTTDGTGPTSALAAGVTNGNEMALMELDPMGANLIFSTVFGGTGSESLNGTGGIAIGPGGNVYIATDVEVSTLDPMSPDLPITAGAMQPAWDGTTNAGSNIKADAFLAIFQPPAAPGGTAILTYCTYLGTNSDSTQALPSVGGVAVDSSGAAYIAGATRNDANGFPTPSGVTAPTYAGGTSDAFVMKIQPAGSGTSDLVYSALFGGAGADAATAITFDSTTPLVYIAGTTTSQTFANQAVVTGYRTSLPTNAVSCAENTFVAVISQGGSNSALLSFLTYLGGSSVDTAESIAALGPNAVYVAGSATSPDFPWHDNAQPFSSAMPTTCQGTQLASSQPSAFVAKVDTTVAGPASLIYATPLSGRASPNGPASSSASAVSATVDSSSGQADVYVDGRTTSVDFPLALTSSSAANGFDPLCVSCIESPPVPSGFLTEISESSAPLPSVLFNLPRVSFSPASPGVTSAASLLGISNSGDAALLLPNPTQNVTIIGSDANDFSLQGLSSCQNSTPPGAIACRLGITFTPSFAGPEQAFLSVADNAPGSPQLLELDGTGTGAVAVITPSTLAFGSVPLGSASAGTITLSNPGNATLTMNSLSPLSPGFVLKTNDCIQGVAGGGTCAIGIDFQPVSLGPAQMVLSIGTNSAGPQGPTQTVTLTGMGVAPAPVASVTPSSIDYGTIPAGTLSGLQTAALTNTGTQALNVSGVNLTGPNANEFVVRADSCLTAGGSSASITPGSNCGVEIAFAPLTAGAKSASLSFSDNASGSAQPVALSGIATEPVVLSASPASINFGPQAAGAQGAPISVAVTITNAGVATGSPGTVTIAGQNMTDFLSPVNSCNKGIPAGGSCTITVILSIPATALPGNLVATLNIPGAIPPTIPLTASVTQPQISITPSGTTTAPVNFGGEMEGIVAADGTPLTFTVTNTSSGPTAGALSFSKVSLGNSPDFTVTQDSCLAGAAVAPAGSCTIVVAFAPACAAAPATRTATLTLTDNAPGNPQTIALSGTATGDFCMAAPAPVSIAPGGTANFIVNVFSANNYTGQVTFTSSGAPANATYTFSPTAAATESISVPAQITLSVITTSASSLSPPSMLPFSGLMRAIGCLTLAALPWLVSRKRGAWRARVVMCGAAAVVALAIISCGGGGGAATTATDPPAATVAGSYTIAISGTAADGTTHSVNATLIVQ